MSSDPTGNDDENRPLIQEPPAAANNNFPTMDDDEEFTLKELAPGVFLCQEKFYDSWNVANIYIVQGTCMDVIVDTGIGIWNLPTYLKQKGLIGYDNKPFLAVATHIHFDHSGGLHQFEEFAIHNNEANAIQSGDSYEAVCFMGRGECAKPPSETWKRSDYKLQPAKPTRILEDGDELDLGDKKLQVLHLPGHSRGSICLFDIVNGHFFSGDVIYDGLVLDWLPFGSIEDNIRSYERIQELSPQVKWVFPGHEDGFDGTKLNDIATRHIARVGMCYKCNASIGRVLFTVWMKGRNTEEKGPKVLLLLLLLPFVHMIMFCVSCKKNAPTLSFQTYFYLC